MIEKDFIDFFKTLRVNNRKEWFDENKKTYEQKVKKPFYELVQTLIEKIGNVIEPEIGLLEPKNCVFRINRDVRFSKDKSPYKIHMSAAFSPGGKTSHIPGFYFQLSDTKLEMGGGAYFLEKEHLYKVRNEIAYCPDEFEKLINTPDFVNTYGTIRGEANKIIPAEFKDMHTRIPLIANKQFYYWAEVNPVNILGDLPNVIMKHFETGAAFNKFFKRALSE